jgi:preprotein translocase subunit SecG
LIGLAFGRGAGRAFHRHSWWLAVLFSLLTAILVLCTLTQVLHIGDLLGQGKLTTQIVLFAIFGAAALFVARGANRAFHRHAWIVGTVLSVVTLFVALCAAFCAVDAIKMIR